MVYLTRHMIRSNISKRARRAPTVPPIMAPRFTVTEIIKVK